MSFIRENIYIKRTIIRYFINHRNKKFIAFLTYYTQFWSLINSEVGTNVKVS